MRSCRSTARRISPLHSRIKSVSSYRLARGAYTLPFAKRHKVSLARRHMTTNLLESMKTNHGTSQAIWEEGNKNIGRPPWGWLLLGIVALSMVYWLWGRGTGVLPLRASTPSQMSVLALEWRSTLPTDSPPDWVVLSPTKSSLSFPLTTFLGN